MIQSDFSKLPLVDQLRTYFDEDDTENDHGFIRDIMLRAADVIDHASAENLAFNIKVSGEIDDLRNQIADARRLAERAVVEAVDAALGEVARMVGVDHLRQELKEARGVGISGAQPFLTAISDPKTRDLQRGEDCHG